MASKKDRILEILKDENRPITPSEITRLTGYNHNTVKAYCRELLKRGQVFQKFRGYYSIFPMYGMGGDLKIHNLILVSEAPWLDFSDDLVEFIGDVKVRVQFGIKRHKITGRISSDKGMDYNTLCFAVSRFYDIGRIRSGHPIDDVMVKTFEANRDIQGIRLDGGLGCLTRKGLFGVIERIYQKDPNTVRLEEKVSVPMSIQSLEALIKGGITGYNMMQGLLLLVNEIRELKEVWKYSNQQINEILEKIEK